MPFVVACGGAPTEGTADEVTVSPPPRDGVGEEIGTVKQAFGRDEFSWGGVANAPPVRMYGEDQGFCFLTQVSGYFYASGDPAFDPFNWFDVRLADAVQVYVNPNDHNWYLGGSGGSGANQYAKALCVQYIDFPNGGAGHFHTVPPGVRLATEHMNNSWQWLWWTDSICYLSGLEGTMDGGGEYVNVYPGGDSGSPTGATWVLVAHTQSPAFTVGAAMCVWTGTPIRFRGRFPFSTAGAAKRMTPAGNTVCMLNKVQGKFRGWGESLHIERRSDGYWWLNGYSQQGPLNAEAECIQTGP